METISRSLLTFLLNSLWQIPLAAAVAALACRFMRTGPSGHRHAVWVAALSTAILLPLASVRSGAPTPASQFTISPDVGAPLASRDTGTVRPVAHPPDGAPLALPSPGSRTISLAATTATILLGAYFLFVLFRLAGLVWACIRTAQIRRAAYPTAMPELLERVWNRCRQAFGVTGVELLVSAQVSGPLTAGRTIILPQPLLGESSEEIGRASCRER